jgi:hypothetical protein
MKRLLGITVEDSALLTNLQPSGGPHNRLNPAKANLGWVWDFAGPDKASLVKVKFSDFVDIAVLP